jgi:hypothetical protein
VCVCGREGVRRGHNRENHFFMFYIGKIFSRTTKPEKFNFI